MSGSPTEPLSFAADFPATTREDWRRLVEKALKGRPFDRLTARSYDGIDIGPIHERWPRASPIAGRAPGSPWQVMQRVDHPDPAAANAQARHDLEGGAAGLSLVYAGAVGAYGYGLPAGMDALGRVLEGLSLGGDIRIDLDLSIPAREAPLHFTAWTKRHGIDPASVHVCCGLDPLRALAVEGASPLEWPQLRALLVRLVTDLASHGLRGPFVVADGRVIHNAGGSEAQELAYVLAAGVAYLRALEDGGIALKDARRMIYLRLSADADQLLTMAKFRAARRLWARVEQASGLAPAPAFIAAETAWRMMTRRDPHANMLRTTIAAAAAGLGGADAVTVLPFTAAIGLPDGFARRMARNCQLILLEESKLAWVADPAAGSGGIETITQRLCEAAWALFQEIEAAGGAYAALTANIVQRRVAAVHARRARAVATRRDPIIGVSAFPALAEAPVQVLDVAPVDVAPVASAAISAEPMPAIRLAEPFEALRDASERQLAANGARPTVFLATLGAPAEFTARAEFARGLFEAGGIAAVSSGEITGVDALLAGYKASGARLACLCGADERYERDGPEAIKVLRAAGARVYAAGRPARADALRAAGIDAFIDSECDALAILEEAHRLLAG